MGGYRLTRRGKFVLTLLVMLVSLGVSIGFKDVVVAEDKFEYTQGIETYEIKSDFYEIDLLEAALEYDNEVVNLNRETQEEEFLSVNVEDIGTYTESKLAFLTFDDGPSENVTPEVLSILDKYNIKATFFVLGIMCEKNGDILQEIKRKGHSIGVHSYTHRLNELLASEESFIDEIGRTEDQLKKHLGDDFSTRLFRFPGGSFESYKKQYMGVLNERGYVSVDWNALTGDTEHINPTPEMLLNRLKATTVNKDNIIVLMHDSDTRAVSAEVLPHVIEYLISESYQFAILK